MALDFGVLLAFAATASPEVGLPTHLPRTKDKPGADECLKETNTYSMVMYSCSCC